MKQRILKKLVYLLCVAAVTGLTACGKNEDLTNGNTIYTVPFNAQTEPRSLITVLPSTVIFDESLRELSNPERGFYVPCLIEGSPNGIIAESVKGNLIHLRISLAEFSHNYLMHKGLSSVYLSAGGWEPLTEDFLSQLNALMDDFRSHGSSVIVRFAYDRFEGLSNMEPDMDGILRHISQLQPFFERNKDIILAVESGFVGQYGEQHSSEIVSPSYSKTTQKTIHTLVQALLETVPSPITVSVRRPTFAAYASGLAADELMRTEFPLESPNYRIGVYNDGMFGSEDDLDTYQNRKDELDWLSNQADHTAFGGEATFNDSTDGFDYTDGNYVSEEMFQTHLTYLNSHWVTETIDSWKGAPYRGDDPLYARESAYTFINNHMGYRYVLRNFQAGIDSISFQVENVGAGNMLKKKNTSLILVEASGNTIEIPTLIDVRTWASQTVADEIVTVSAPNGVYQVYLKITDSNGNQVQFANDNPFNLNGNLIGKIEISGN